MKTRIGIRALAVIAALGTASGADEMKPNVLVVLADDLGFSDLSCYGGEMATPNLDALAKGGLRYSAFYTSARCCPSRASLMTGLHPHEAGIGSFATANPEPRRGPAYTGHLLPDTLTMAEFLRTSGYSTWMVGKWHMGNPGPIERGFDHYYGYRNTLSYAEDQWNPGGYVRLPAGVKPELGEVKDGFYATDVFNDYALEFLKQARSMKKPWLLYLAHSSPHFPVQAPLATIEKHLPTYRKGWDLLRAERFERLKALGLVPAAATLPPRSYVPVDEPKITDGYSGETNPAWDDLPLGRREDLAWRMATYAAMVEHLDAGIGRLVADLKDHGDFDNTLIFFMSDNGACYEWGPFGFDGPSRQGKNVLRAGEELRKTGQSGTHQSYGSAWANLCNTPLRSYKHFCHEGGIASPLVVHWPRGITRKGEWVHDPAHLMDLLPTVIDAAGGIYPEQAGGAVLQKLSGVSLRPTFSGRKLSTRSLAFEHQGARSLRKGDWKVVWGKRQRSKPAWELFHLSEDRSELDDLAAADPAKTAELAAEWMSWAKEAGVHVPEGKGR